MKRTITMLLVFIMLIFLTACQNGSSGESVSSEPASAPSSDVSSDTSSEASSEASSEVLSEETSSTYRTYDIYTVGEISDKGVFTNPFIGIGFNFDKSWEYLTQDDIYKMNKANIIAELITLESVCCAQGINEDGTQLIVTIDNPKEVFGVEKTAEEYAEASMHNLAEELRIAGVEDVKLSRSTHRFAGAVRDIVYIEYSIGDVSFNGAAVFIPRNQHVATAFVATVDGSDPKTILSKFYAVELNKPN